MEGRIYMTQNQKLYYLLNKYLTGEYDTNTFCDLFSDTFNLELDNSISILEEQIFEELMRVTSRFSPFEEDLRIPNAFYNEHEVKSKAEEILNKLNLLK
jgi:hypothetical protein